MSKTNLNKQKERELTRQADKLIKQHEDMEKLKERPIKNSPFKYF